MKEATWITSEEAATLLELSMSGFYSVAKEQRRLTGSGENVLCWRKVGRQYRYDRDTVLLYKERR